MIGWVIVMERRDYERWLAGTGIAEAPAAAAEGSSAGWAAPRATAAGPDPAAPI